MLQRLFFFSILYTLFFTHSYTHQCLDHQKTLLLELKNELIFNSSISTKLVQWNQRDDCCKWYGVECDAPGNVISLKLDDEAISGGIGDSSSLFRLMYLQRLNLAYNEFNNNPIPKGIENLTYLTHLNLSHAGFGGQVPAELSSLKRLVSLDISNDYMRMIEPLKLELPNLEMLLSNLTGLRELYLDVVNIPSSDERRKWSHIISSYLPNLTTLSLVHCGLSGSFAKSFWQLHSLSILRLDYNNLSTTPDLFVKFSSLTTLSLVECKLKGYFPETIFHLPNLQNLDLSVNELLTGSIPSFTQTESLKSLILSVTNFTGSLPSSISNLTALSWIDLSYSQFTGSIPSTFANLTQLVYVDLLNNFFTGSLSSSMFGGLSNLVYLDLGDNSFSGSIPHSLFCLPSLQLLSLSGNKFNEQVEEFPIVNVSNIVTLELSGNGLEGPIPDSFFQLHSLEFLYLDGNMFNGTLQSDKIQNLANLTRLYLSHNSDLPVDASNHNSSTYQLHHLQYLGIASCNLSVFPDFIKHSDMLSLDLSNNRIAGEIRIWIWKSQLWELNLSLNLLTDFQKPYQIPASLYSLDLHSNQLRGELHLPFPSNTGNNTSLLIWLRALLLANNNFSGSIPTFLCSAPTLSVLDLSLNRISGNIPSCLNRLSVLALGRNNISGLISGQEVQIVKIWQHFNAIDLSCNNFRGNIPNAIGNLSSIHLLNLSYNALNGSIPKSLGHMRALESLDLSQNSLTFLSVLNMSSYNNLVGKPLIFFNVRGFLHDIINHVLRD